MGRSPLGRCELPSPPAALQQSTRRRPWFWLLVAGIAVFISLEPSWFLVTVALGLSALALFWMLLLAWLLIADAVGYATRRQARSSNRDDPATR
jgi:hypothetical protein